MIAAVPISGTDTELRNALVVAGLPANDIAEAGRCFFRVERDGELLGFGGFELYGEDALLRSLAVPAEIRGNGAGRIVTETILGAIAVAGGKRAYVLTTSAAGFLEHLGFVRIDRAEAPASILGTQQASSICSSAALLSRAI